MFAKQNIADSKGKWVDIVECQRYEYSDNELDFRFVECGLYKRLIRPKYPPESEYTENGKFDEKAYYLAVRAITWEVAHQDIAQQKLKGIIGEKYRITGVRYNKNNGKYRSQPPWLDPKSAFYGDSPRSFRWSERQAYEYKPEWVYEIKSVEKLN